MWVTLSNPVTGTGKAFRHQNGACLSPHLPKHDITSHCPLMVELKHTDPCCLAEKMPSQRVASKNF